MRALGFGVLALSVAAGGALAQSRAQPTPNRPAQPQQQQPAQAPQSAAPGGNLLGTGGGTGPLQIDSDRLEVRDREKQAIFSGNVVAVRGEAMLRATVMTVFYEGEARPGATPAPAAPAAPAAAGAQQGQQIRRIEMQGPVFFCQRTQTARGDRAVYNRAEETLVMTGNVVLTDGPQNVVTGPRLVVNLRTSQANVVPDPAQPGERVRMILSQQAPQTSPPPAPQRPARPGQPAPQRPC